MILCTSKDFNECDHGIKAQKIHKRELLLDWGWVYYFLTNKSQEVNLKIPSVNKVKKPLLYRELYLNLSCFSFPQLTDANTNDSCVSSFANDTIIRLKISSVKYSEGPQMDISQVFLQVFENNVSMKISFKYLVLGKNLAQKVSDIQTSSQKGSVKDPEAITYDVLTFSEHSRATFASKECSLLDFVNSQYKGGNFQDNFQSTCTLRQDYSFKGRETGELTLCIPYVDFRGHLPPKLNLKPRYCFAPLVDQAAGGCGKPHLQRSFSALIDLKIKTTGNY